jgi:hypothetical protein
VSLTSFARRRLDQLPIRKPILIATAPAKRRSLDAVPAGAIQNKG